MENKKNFYIDGKWVTPKSKEEIKVIKNVPFIALQNAENLKDKSNFNVFVLIDFIESINSS